MRKTEPTRRQRTAVAQHRSAGDRLRDWIQRRQAAAGARRMARRVARATSPPPVDDRPVVYVHQHTSRPFTPYVNPRRDRKPGARLRKELR